MNVSHSCARAVPPLPPTMSDQQGADELRAMFQSMGVHLTARWFADCASHLSTTNPGYASFDSKRKVDEAYLQFLEADMNHAGEGCVPPDGLLSLPTEKVGLDASNASGGAGENGNASNDVAHRRVWRGRFVLQCDEIVNVASSFHDRYSEKRAGDDRTLKLSMTDGKQRIVGYEYRPCDALHVLAPAGIKVAVTDPEVGADGMLYLRPENLTVLGGSVARLEEARRRVVARWSEPNQPALNGRGNERRPETSREEAVANAAWGEVGTPEPRSEPVTRAQAAAPAPAPAPVTRPPIAMNDGGIDLTADDDDDDDNDPGWEALEEVERNISAAGKNKKPPEPEPPKPEEPKTEPKGTPPERVRKRRVVCIPDSDDDPTQSGGVKLSDPVSEAPDVPPDAAPVRTTRGPPPEWAVNMCRSTPFTYIAAFQVLQRSTGHRPEGASYKSVAVTLHCRYAAVGALTVVDGPSADDKRFRLNVSLDDGTGVVAGELTHECIVRTLGRVTVSAFQNQTPERRGHTEDWLRRFLSAFQGRVAATVSQHDDGSAARVNKMQGPDDVFDVKDVRALGVRFEKFSSALREK